MTITYLELSGDQEDLDVTIANLLTEDWDSDNTNSLTPNFRHGGSDPDSRRAGHRGRKRADKITCKIAGHSNDEENSDSSKTHNRMASDIEIKIETDNKVMAELYMFEVNRILSEAHPNNSTRILKVDNANSMILYLSPPVPNWTPDIPDTLGHGTILYSGIITAEWAFERS